MTQIAKVEFSILSPGLISRATRIGLVEQLSIDRIKSSYKSRGVLLGVPLPLIEQWALTGILRSS